MTLAAGLDGLAGPIGGIAAAVIVSWWLKRISRQGVQTADGQTVVQYHRGHTILSWIGLLFFLFLLIMSSIYAKPREKLFCGVIFGGFASMAAVMLVTAYRCRITYSAVGLINQPLFGPAFSAAWEDVVAVKYAAFSQWWVIRLKNGRKIRASIYMNGLVGLLEELHTRTGMPESSAD